MKQVIHTLNQIQIAAPAATIYGLAADVRRWPDLLDHYRYVEPQSDGSFLMSATRSGLPVEWRAHQYLDPPHRIRYHHTGGATRGMDVAWILEPSPGGTLVSIDHVLAADRAHLWARNPLAAHVIGDLFVVHIADRTLMGIKKHAERRP